MGKIKKTKSSPNDRASGGGIFSGKSERSDAEPSLFDKIKLTDTDSPIPVNTPITTPVPLRKPGTKSFPSHEIAETVNADYPRHASVYCHKDTLHTNRFRTSVIYVSRDFGVKEFGSIIALKLRNSITGEDKWVAGHKELCACNATYFANCATRTTGGSNCNAYGISPFLCRQIPENLNDWKVREVLSAAERSSRAQEIRCYLQPSEPKLPIPILRNALRSTCVTTQMQGEIVALGGRIYKYTIEDIITADGHASVAFVDPGDSIRMVVRYTKLEDHEEEDKDDLRGFARMGGCELVIKTLERALVSPLTSPEKYLTAKGTLKGLRPTKGILLYGVPGTGKSYLCKALEEELLFSWKHREPSELAAGVSVQILNGANIRDDQDLSDVFRRAKDRYDLDRILTLLIIDEIDSLCPKRTDSTSDDRIALINCLLTHLDGPMSHWSTFLLATTNRPEAIDEALRRPGRLDKEVELLVPSLKERCSVLRKLLKRYKVDIPDLDEVTLEALCIKASGFVPSDIDAWVRHAVESASDVGTGQVDVNVLTEAVKAISPSALKEFAIEVPKVSWADIGGYEDVKTLLQECVEWPLRYSAEFQTLNLKSSKGVLMYGPPGNSKTLMAKAVASQSSMNFIAVKGPELFSKYVGESERKLREIFKRARQYSPTIIFFDEIDSIGADRAKTNSTNSVEARLLSQLLNEMDGIELSADVIVLAATNRPDAIDPALLRPGRFDKLVYVSLPNAGARKQIYSVYLPHLSDAESIELADHSAGYSGAEIEQICQAAKMAVFRRFVEDRSITRDENASDHVLKVTVPDVLKELQITKPRTSAAQISYYGQFASQKS